jgi:hypothetical protein
MDNIVETSLQLLGCKGTDKVTGFTGFISTVGFDAYGCVQLALTPPKIKDQKLFESYWFDVKRVTVGKRVMDVPDYCQIKKGKEIGAAEKPRMRP